VTSEKPLNVRAPFVGAGGTGQGRGGIRDEMMPQWTASGKGERATSAPGSHGHGLELGPYRLALVFPRGNDELDVQVLMLADTVQSRGIVAGLHVRSASIGIRDEPALALRRVPQSHRGRRAQVRQADAPPLE